MPLAVCSTRSNASTSHITQSLSRIAMPVSHICLTVSHLPTSCSFFLETLAPLGYRYISKQDCQVGFGINEPDFFICQAPTGYYIHAFGFSISFSARNADRTLE